MSVHASDGRGNQKKAWVSSQQDWTWIITIAWMAIANIWKPFGLFGFVCFLTPIGIALSGRGKMHCARLCPRGSLIGQIGRRVNIGLKRPTLFGRKPFRVTLWAVVMGVFIAILVVFAPKGVYALGNAVLIFMEVMTVIAIIFGIVFAPRTWCTVCPMGFTTQNIRNAMNKRSH